MELHWLYLILEIIWPSHLLWNQRSITTDEKIWVFWMASRFKRYKRPLKVSLWNSLNTRVKSSLAMWEGDDSYLLISLSLAQGVTFKFWSHQVPLSEGGEYCFRPTAVFWKLYAQFEYNRHLWIINSNHEFITLESSFEQKCRPHRDESRG